MNWVYAAYAAVLLATSAISFAVALEIWQRRHAPGGWPLFVFQAGVIIWSLTYAIHWLSKPVTAHFWLDMTYLGVVIIPTSFLFFVLQFTLRGRFLTPWSILLFSIEPVLTLALILTNPLHRLFQTLEQVRYAHRFFQGGPVFWVNAVYSYGIILIGIILLIYAVRRSNYNYRRQAGTVLIGASLPFFTSIATFFGLNPFTDLDLTPIAFSATGIFLAVALSRYQLLKVIPIARYTLVESMTDGVIVLDDQKIIVDINPAILRLLQMPHTALIGKAVENAFENRPEIAGLCCTKENSHSETQWSLDPLQYFDLQITVLRGKDEQIEGWLLIWRDITELKIAQKVLAESEQRYGYLLETAAFPVVITSTSDNIVLYANQRTTQLFEMEGPPLGQPVYYFYQDIKDRAALLNALAEHGHVNNYEIGFKTRTGRPIWALISANTIEFNGRPAVFTAINDITDRRKLEQDMRNLQRAVEQSASTVVITDINGDIVYVNPAFTLTSGYEASEVIGKNPRILKSGHQSSNYYQGLWSTITNNEAWKGNFRNARKDGSLYWESATISPIRDLEGNITGYLAVKEDITQRKEAEEELQRLNTELNVQLNRNQELSEILREQAIHDPLTNLFNRRYLNETLPREFSRAQRENYPISILMVDIDRFKGFNDTHGHDAGDMVLQSLAATLLEGTRAEDIVVRYGGEEILVILINTPANIALERAEALRAAISQMTVLFAGVNLRVTVSIGAATYPASGDTPEEVIRASDLAMYRAKAAGRNCVSA